MKILHINTFDKGGAGKAAIRLHRAMLNAGMDSTLLTLSNTDLSIPNHLVYGDVHIPAEGWSKWKKLNPLYLIKRFYKLKKWKRNEEIKLAMEGVMEFISFHETAYRIHEIKDFATYDIIHLHWIADFLDWPTFFPAVKDKKIVWSLHDMAPFTGGYHYASGYEGYIDNDKGAPFLKNTKWESHFEQELLAKTKILSTLQLDLHIVGLSNWMRACAERSKLFKMYTCYFIPNVIDIDTFKPIDKAIARSEFDLPLDKKIVLFIAEHVNNTRKGFDFVEQVMDYFKENNSVVFVVIGNTSKIYDLDKVYGLDFIVSEEKIALALNAADIVLLPSREDNLPNTVLESLMCGTPVIGNAIGGMPDLIFDPILGALADTTNTLEVLIEKQLLLLSHKEDLNKKMIERFSPDSIVFQYNLIYEKRV